MDKTITRIDAKKEDFPKKISFLLFVVIFPLTFVILGSIIEYLSGGSVSSVEQRSPCRQIPQMIPRSSIIKGYNGHLPSLKELH